MPADRNGSGIRMASSVFDRVLLKYLWSIDALRAIFCNDIGDLASLRRGFHPPGDEAGA